MSEELRSYFENMFSEIDSNIKLDDDQINAIINDNPAVLILAGAGTGKTTTMAAKVKYLVDIKHVDPSKILVISYTRKAVEELRDIINDKFDINCYVSTFHSFAYKYVRHLFSNRKCVVVDHNFREDVFNSYIDEKFKSNGIKELVDTFNNGTLKMFGFYYGNYFINNYDRFNDFESYFEAYKSFKMDEAKTLGLKMLIDEWVEKRLVNDKAIFTIQGELVKSAGEAVIANFLFKHGIDYSYEKIYENLVEDRKIYRPDFTLDLGGQSVYLEYFGMNDLNYNMIKNKKIKYHTEHKNKFIYIDKMSLDDIEKVLDSKLKKFGFVYRDRSEEEIYSKILDQNKLSQIFRLKSLFYDTLSKIKESPKRSHYFEIVEDYINNLNEGEKELAVKQYELFTDFYSYYSRKLYRTDVYSFDFSDLLYYMNKYISDKRYLTDIKGYDYMIIDEYQDISDSEYLLAKKSSERYESKVFSVGDDWQSIYAFRGSNIGYITNFERYFKNPNIISIKYTYRNSQELIDVAGNFIMKNPNQLQKELVSSKHLYKPIKFVPFSNSFDDLSGEYTTLRNLVLKIHKNNPKHSILILGRNNRMIDRCFEYNEDFIQDIDGRIKIAGYSNLQLDGMTIHKSKGLTYDEVIIIGMNKSFPNERHNDFWISSLFKTEATDNYPFAEERRLFYVALTRTKNNVYILYNEKPKYRSVFVDELMDICKEMGK